MSLIIQNFGFLLFLKKSQKIDAISPKRKMHAHRLSGSVAILLSLLKPTEKYW